MQDAIHEAFARRYNSDPADPACATDVAVYSAGWRDARPTQAPVLDDRWKARMLDGRALERDAQGFGGHPDLPATDEDMHPPKFFESLGMQLAGRSAEDDLDMDAYDTMSGTRDLEVYDFNGWTPSRPDGDGWCLVSIHDTEDGPVAWWLRKLPHGAIVRSRRRAGERDDLTAEECREYFSSGWARVRGRAERALVLQLSELLDAKAAPAAAAGPTPATFMTEDRALEWAWNKVREEVGTKGWTAGDSCNFHGFFLWGWKYRAQYDLQRTATLSALKQELTAVPALEAPAAPQAPAAPLGMVHVLPTVIRKLIEELNKASPGNSTTAKAEDYLKLHALRMQALGAATAATAELSQAARDVLAERARQINAEGFSPARDDQYVGLQLAGAATSYLILAAGGREDEARAFWPWRQEWLKPGSPRRYLEKVGALVLAEMERLDRAAAQAEKGCAAC